MRDLQTAELWLVTGGQTAPTGGSTTTTTNTNTNTSNQGFTGNLTFGPGGQPTGGSVGYNYTTGSTTTTTTTTVTTAPPAGADPRDTTPQKPIERPTQQQEIPEDLIGLF